MSKPVEAEWWTCRTCGTIQDPDLAQLERIAFQVALGLDLSSFAFVVSSAARALRTAMTLAWIDVISDSPYPESAGPAVDALRSVGREQGTDMAGIEIDVRDDDQFEHYVALLPYTIHAEAWQGAH